MRGEQRPCLKVSRRHAGTGRCWPWRTGPTRSCRGFPRDFHPAPPGAAPRDSPAGLGPARCPGRAAPASARGAGRGRSGSGNALPPPLGPRPGLRPFRRGPGAAVPLSGGRGRDGTGRVARLSRRYGGAGLGWGSGRRKLVTKMPRPCSQPAAFFVRLAARPETVLARRDRRAVLSCVCRLENWKEKAFLIFANGFRAWCWNAKRKRIFSLVIGEFLKIRVSAAFSTGTRSAQPLFLSPVV